jgi:hypothetical protein
LLKTNGLGNGYKNRWINWLTNPLSICTWIIKFLVWKIEFDEIDFCRLHRQYSNSIFQTKGQLISKGHFGIINSSKKWTWKL